MAVIFGIWFKMYISTIFGDTDRNFAFSRAETNIVILHEQLLK